MKTLILITTFLAACHSAPRPAPTTPSTVAELAGHRAQMIQWLHEYYEAGVYPTDAAGMPLSVFKDERGVRCPMAELIFKSGHGDLVDAVAREHNTVRLADVKEGPLYDWMLGSGLTQEEIAMVQGAMEMNYSYMRELQQPEPILARAQVRGRLEVAERALTDGTNHGLNVITSRLPDGRVPAVAAVKGTVVPKAAIRQPPQPVAVPSRFASRYSMRGVN